MNDCVDAGLLRSYIASDQGVPAINQDIRARSVRAGIAGEVQKSTLELLDLALSAQRRHPVCLVDACVGGSHFRLKETGTQDIGPCETTPFPRQRFAQVCDRRLRVRRGGMERSAEGQRNCTLLAIRQLPSAPHRRLAFVELYTGWSTGTLTI